MNYVEKMLEKADKCWFCEDEELKKFINQIIADTKRACCDAAEDALDHNHTMCDWCVDAIAACEVKGE